MPPETAQHTFTAPVKPIPSAATAEATIALHDTDGIPVPWPQAQAAILSILESSPLTDLPAPAISAPPGLRATLRPCPIGSTTDSKGVRHHHASLEFGGENDPDGALPSARIWTTIAVPTGCPPVYVDVIQSPGAARHDREIRARRMAETYGLHPLDGRTAAEIQRALHDLAWDMAHQPFSADFNTLIRIEMLNYRNRARWHLEAVPAA